MRGKQELGCQAAEHPQVSSFDPNSTHDDINLQAALNQKSKLKRMTYHATRFLGWIGLVSAMVHSENGRPEPYLWHPVTPPTNKNKYPTRTASLVSVQPQPPKRHHQQPHTVHRTTVLEPTLHNHPSSSSLVVDPSSSLRNRPYLRARLVRRVRKTTATTTLSPKCQTATTRLASDPLWNQAQKQYRWQLWNQSLRCMDHVLDQEEDRLVTAWNCIIPSTNTNNNPRASDVQQACWVAGGDEKEGATTLIVSYNVTIPCDLVLSWNAPNTATPPSNPNDEDTNASTVVVTTKQVTFQFRSIPACIHGDWCNPSEWRQVVQNEANATDWATTLEQDWRDVAAAKAAAVASSTTVVSLHHVQCHYASPISSVTWSVLPKNHTEPQSEQQPQQPRNEQTVTELLVVYLLCGMAVLFGVTFVVAFLVSLVQEATDRIPAAAGTAAPPGRRSTFMLRGGTMDLTEASLSSHKSRSTCGGGESVCLDIPANPTTTVHDTEQPP